MKTFALVAGLGAALLLSAPAAAVTINFNDLAVGTILSTQYAGVTFAANGFTGTGGPTGDWATNTDMTIVSSTGTDVGGLGTPSLISGNLLRSFDGWLNENGDPSFSISFTSAISFFSLDFAGVATPADVKVFVYNGVTLLSTVSSAVTTGQFTLSYSAPSFTRLVVTPGSFDDWVGVDNLVYTPVAVTPGVPEPASWAMMIGGFALAGASMRRARRSSAVFA